MSSVLRLAYSGAGPTAMPLLPLTLQANSLQQEVIALVDTGASVNVLPYEVGIALGFRWEDQVVPVELGGNLGAAEARAIALVASIGEFAPTRLVFAWSRQAGFRPILGQMNFFLEFDTCFFRAEGTFEIRAHDSH